jgi:hypothetical protein
MTCRIEAVGAASWRFCPDELEAQGSRLRALVVARAIDEITQRPAKIDEVATPDRRLALHVVPRNAGDGLVGLAGKPASIFPDLGLTGASIPLRIGAQGYLPLALDGTLGPFAGFPDAFTPLDHGDVDMHRVGVAFNGRVVAQGTPANTPLAAAIVEVDGVWPVAPPPNVLPSTVMQPARIVGLDSGMYGDPAAATLSRCDFVEDLPQTKRLLLPASRGAQRLRLDNRQTLAIGMPLLIDAQDMGRREVIGIRAVDTSFSDDQPAWIDLDYPTRHLHRASAQVVPASVPATHDPRTLARPALAGDRIAFLTAAAPWASATLIQVDDGVNPLEYQRIVRYETVSDADGYFRLPPISRLALFRLRVAHATQAQPLLLTIEPDYRLADQNIAVAFE